MLLAQVHLFELGYRELNMADMIDVPAKCELHSVVHFLQAEIHQLTSQVHGVNFMCNGVLSEWYRKHSNQHSWFERNEGLP